MKKIGGDVWALAGLVTVFAVMAYLIAGKSPQGEELIPHRTTYSNRTGGYKAAYLLLKQRGLPVLRSNAHPAQWPKAARVMITATPFDEIGGHGWSKATVDKALDWVEAGNTLIIACDSNNDLLKELHLKKSDRGEVKATLVPGQPLPLFDGVKSVYVPGATRWESAPLKGISLLSGNVRTKPGTADATATAQHLPALIVLRSGKGYIFALSSPEIWDNQNLDEADNARLLVQLVESQLPKGAAVAWDEFHQGYDNEASFWTVVGTPGLLTFYQLVAVAILAVYAAGRRFGLAKPAASAARVSSEYVASLADLYRRARAADAALLGVYTAFRRDLCRTLGVATETDDAALVRQCAALLDPVKRTEYEEQLRRLLADCALRTVDQSNLPSRERTVLSDTELLRLSQEMEFFRKELSIGRTR